MKLQLAKRRQRKRDLKKGHFFYSYPEPLIPMNASTWTALILGAIAFIALIFLSVNLVKLRRYQSTLKHKIEQHDRQ